jgi:SAM-dependent methyltransferase
MKCLCCKNKVTKFFDFGKMPPSDYFAPTKNLALKSKTFRLEVGRCGTCHLVQNLYIVSANERYKKNRYSYNSANSIFAKKHWAEYVKNISNFISKESKIIDVGCNDGYLLSLLKKKTNSKYIFGLDPSGFQINKSKRRYKNINFKCGYGEQIVDFFGEDYFDVITCNNVFNHSSNPLLFLKCIKSSLKDSGLIIIEVPNWINTVKNKLWDQIYHEHVSYFTPFSVCKIFKKADLKIVKIDNINYHGGSLRIFAKKSGDSIFYNKDAKLTECKFLAKSAMMRKAKAIKKINTLKNHKIFLFGAPAKGNTLINYFGLNNNNIFAAFETSKNKIGKFFPKACIPIISEKNVLKSNGYLINLNWNIPFVFDKFCKKNKFKKLII